MSKQHPKVAFLREMARHERGTAAEVLRWAAAVCESADNLVNVKGRFHAELGYKRLEDAVNVRQEEGRAAA